MARVLFVGVAKASRSVSLVTKEATKDKSTEVDMQPLIFRTCSLSESLDKSLGPRGAFFSWCTMIGYSCSFVPAKTNDVRLPNVLSPNINRTFAVSVVVVVFVSVVGGTSNERILLMKQMAPMGTIIVELQIMC